MNLQTPAAAKRPATYQDVIDAPEHMVAEIVAGELSLQPRPRPRHARAITRLGARIAGQFDMDDGGPGGWVILIEPELHLGGDVLVPDVAGWRRERLPKLPDEVGIAVAPDWVCEVLSPSTRRLDVTVKRDAYGREGVAHLWFVDPAARTLEAFSLAGGAWTLASAHAGDATVRLAPFDAAELALAPLWAD